MAPNQSFSEALNKNHSKKKQKNNNLGLLYVIKIIVSQTGASI